MATEAVAVSAAIKKDNRAALNKASSSNRDLYHFNEKPDHEVMMADSLKENTTKNTMGKYKKPKPMNKLSARK